MGLLTRAAPLCAAVLLLAAPLAHAQATQDFTAFTLQSQQEPSPGTGLQALVLQSETQGATVFTLPSLAGELSVLSGGPPDLREYALSAWITPRAGYTVTGFEFNGTLDGALDVQQAPADALQVTPGSAHNIGTLTFGLQQVSVTDLDGAQALAMTLQADNAAPGSNGALNVNLSGLLSSRAEYTYYWNFVNGEYTENRLGSNATLAVLNPTLTVYWTLQPVPEPANWTLFLSGAPVVLWRRRRASRCAD